MMYRITILSLFCLTWFLSPAQEINHAHSIQHAFLENKGQWEKEVLFKSKFDGGNLWVQQNKMMFHLQDYSATHDVHGNFGKIKKPRPNRQTLVHLNFLGSNEVSTITKDHATENYYNYFIGNDESKWASEVRGYGEAVLHELYDGIDLKLIEELEQLKYEFHVKPYVDPAAIQLEYAGQDNIEIDRKGNLVVSTKLGEIIEQKPYAYQIVNGNIREVECEFLLVGSTVQFKLGAYDEYAILVIDPVLIFATYSGSPTDNFGMTATYGNDGTAYSGGMIFGNAYPTPFAGAYDISSSFTVVDNPTYGITDAFISKYSPDGANMLWTTFLGGGSPTQGTETAQSMVCDAANNVYLYGATSSTDFPIVGGYQSLHNGGEDSLDFYQNGVHFTDQGTDIYVAKISSNGANLLASTFIGGSGNDGVNYKLNVPYNYFISLGDTLASGTYSSFSAYDSLTINYGDQFRGEIILDSVGNCVVASCTRSTDFPTASPFQGANGGGQDGVVFKLSADLSVLQWSSYYGGSNNDACYSVKIDSAYEIAFAGGTSSNDLPNMGAGWQPVYNGGESDGFVVKLNTTGTAVINASYIGTSDRDQAFFVEIDRNNNVFLLGQSRGGNFPVINTSFVNPGSSQFVMKLDPTLTVPLNSTVFGNASPDINISPAAFLVDICGNIYISGWGANLLQGVPLGGMPITPLTAVQPDSANGFVFYLLVIERDFGGILYGTYLGSPSAREHVDGGTSRFDKNGVVYQSVCGGCGGSDDFPTTAGAWSQDNLSTNCNNVVFKFDFELIPKAEFTADDNIGCVPFTVTFDNFSTQSDSYLWDFGNGDTSTVIFYPTITYDSVGVYDVFLYVTDSICLLVDTAHLVITVLDSIELTVTPGPIQLCTPVPTVLTANSFGTADYFIWSTNSSFTDTLNSPITDSTATVTPSGSGYYYVQAGNAGCSRIDSVEIEFIGGALLLNGNDSICLGETTTFTASSSNPLISYSYVWSPASIIVGSSTGTSVIVEPDFTQYLYVTATSTTGCVADDSILIYVGNIPAGAVNATSSDYLIASGGTVTLSGQPNGYSYLWTPPFGVSNTTAQQTDAVVDETTLYTLFVTDGICTRSDTVLVKTFTFICDEPFVYVPNAFTPDGLNDNNILYVRGALIKDMVFRVFDRWGELVFESFDRSSGWDGNFRGKPMDPDTYDYYLKVTCLDDVESIIKGNVTLIR